MFAVAAMSDLSTVLLKQLKDYTNCNDDLALKIRKTILEPFQLDLTRPDTIKKPPPSPTRFKQMATQLAPVAMRIVNQNIEGLMGLKRNMSATINYTVAVNCLVDTSFYALTALRHMNSFTALKPLDIEKTTSNLICKMVELGEYNRALDEIRKFRSLLASVAKVPLDNKTTVKQVNARSPTTTSPTTKGFLTESPRNHQATTTTRHSLSPVPDSLVSNQWEEEMLLKYRDLFYFPLDLTINDRTMLLLILAYQMNALRCWCEINEGALTKFVPYFMERTGNFVDWSKQLMSIDAPIAKKQLDSFQKLLYKAASKYPVNDSTAFNSYNVQTVALEVAKISGTSALKGVMDRLVRIGVTYEKTSSHTQYKHIQQRCQQFLETVSPNVGDIAEMDSYFVLCEYLAYASRKAKNYEGALSAYQYIACSVHEEIQSPTCSYYYAAHAASAKLAIGSLQMDKMVSEEKLMNICTMLSDITSCLSLVFTALKDSPPSLDDHIDSALSSLCKAMDGFRQSSKRLYEMVTEKTKQCLIENKNNPLKTPPRRGEITNPTDFGPWNANVSQIIAVLQQCSETLPANLNLVKKKTVTQGKRGTTQSDIMISFIDIMVLLTRMHFNIHDEDTHNQAYEYLSTAEQLCAEIKFPEGYRWLSVSYYNLGATMIKAELFSSAVYPLRKSCSLLEKDTERINTDEGKLQICKRYEVLGTCCQKNERFSEAIRAYRMALQRAPISAIEKFISQASTTAVSAIAEANPLIFKLLDRFLRASIIDPDQSEIQFGCEFLDLSTLSVVQQCIIYECELRVWNVLALKMDLIKFQMMIIEKLLECYDSENFPVRRARVLLTQVRVERSRNSESGTRTAMACAQEAIQLLKVQNYGCDTNLLKYRVHYLGLASSWVAICARELNEAAQYSFFTTMQQWGILLKRITPIYNSGGSSKADILHVYDSVDDLDHFYDHVKVLVDLFGVTGQYVYQINALRMLLKLNNGLRDVSVDHVSESIMISSTIGKIYCDLGYTGKASVEFKQAQNAITNRACNKASEILYRINYAYYLTQIGDYDTSKEIFDSTKLTWECNQTSQNHKNELATAKAYTDRCMLLADVYTTKALLLAQTETIDSAIICYTNALKLLNKCLKVVQKTNQGRQEMKQQSGELDNPFMPTPPPSQAKEEAERIVFRESQWILAQKIASSLTTLASLHMKKGAWNEAKYFVKQGPLLAEKVNSNALYFNSYLCASEFHLRCGNYSQSQDDIEKALAYQLEGRFHEQEAARLKVAVANLAVANNVYVEAIDAYDEANLLLRETCNSTYISSLEQLSDIKESTSRGNDNNNGAEPRVTFEDQVDKTDRYDFIPLQKLQHGNIIRKALALSMKGDTAMGLDLLDKIEEFGSLYDVQVEYDVAITNIRMKLLREEIASQPDAKVFLHDSLSLPVMKVQVARGAVIKRTNVSQERRVMRDNLASNLESMIEAHRLGCYRERSSIIQSLCNEIGFGILLKNQFSPANTRVIAKDSALLTSYYMEMSKCLSMRREMQLCLDVKRNKVAVGQSPSDSQWPKSDAEHQDGLSGRFSEVNLNPKWLQAHLSSLSELYREEHELNDEDFQQKFIDILPANWTVCSLTFDPVNNDLYAVQMRTGEAPFVVKIPLNRSQHRSKKYSVINYNEAVAEFQDIIRASDETIHNSDKTQPDQVDSWWNTRIELDNRLKVLVESIESQWFSGFKGLLSGRTQEDKEELVKFQKHLSEFIYKTVIATVPFKKQIELSLTLCRMVLRLGRRPSFRELEDLIYFALTCYEAQEVQLDYTKIDILKTAEKIKALIVQYHNNASAAGVDTIKIIPNDHVILILDKHLQVFPMESIPILRPQSTSRLPCLSFLRDRILYTQSYESRYAFDDFGMNIDQWKDMSVSRNSAFYVLNPGGDLKDTQKEFEAVFSSMPEWDGITQTMPAEFQCKDALQSRDIYMYFGHSAGQAFMRGTTVRQLPTCAVSLLMGCSSGTLEANGEFDSYGYILNYLLAGSPAVVGNLWDVTDRSIDRLTKYMLRTWGLLKTDTAPFKPKSLVQAVTESRSQCKLPYLIGAAPVVYGIPVYIKNTTT